MILRNAFFFAAGIGFLSLAKATNTLREYSSSKPFDHSDMESGIEYNDQVVGQWLAYVADYARSRACLSGRYQPSRTEFT